eukprot:453360-Amphidinium_carterae.1
MTLSNGCQTSAQSKQEGEMAATNIKHTIVTSASSLRMVVADFPDHESLTALLICWSGYLEL